MTRRSWRILALFALVVPLAGLADAPATLDRIVTRGIAAAGGADRLHSLRSIRMAGSITLGDGGRHPMTVEMERPGRIRTEIDLGEKGRIVQAFDGERGWKIDPFSGSTKPAVMSPPEEKEAREQADLDGPLLDWRKRGIQLTLLPDVEVEGRKAHELKVVFPSGSERFLFLDAATGLKAEWQGSLLRGGQKMVFESFFEDYRDLGGLKLPYRIRSRAQGSDRSQSIEFQTIEVDREIPVSRFQMPHAANQTPGHNRP